MLTNAFSSSDWLTVLGSLTIKHSKVVESGVRQCQRALSEKEFLAQLTSPRVFAIGVMPRSLFVILSPAAVPMISKFLSGLLLLSCSVRLLEPWVASMAQVDKEKKVLLPFCVPINSLSLSAPIWSFFCCSRDLHYTEVHGFCVMGCQCWELSLLCNQRRLRLP